MDVLGTLKIQQLDVPALKGIQDVGPAIQRNLPKAPQKGAQEAQENGSGAREKAAALEQQTEKKVERVVAALQDYVQSVQRDLHIKVHKPTGEMMVQVISAKDGKVVREIPPEEVLNLAARIEEMMGVLYDANA